MRKYVATFFVLLILLVFGLYLAGALKLPQKTPTSISLSIYDMPFSTDPLEYDYAAHHFAFRSVYVTLFSTYKLGRTMPILAESWTTLDEYKSWRFTIRKDMKFASGELITPKIVWQNFMRAALRMKQQNSNSGLFEYLAELEKLDALESKFAGLNYDDKSVFIKFTVPIKNIVNKLSFGLYAIANPKFWNDKGVWLNPKALDASGPYNIKNWSTDSLSYELRQDFPHDLRHENASENLLLAIGNIKDSTIHDIYIGSPNIEPIGSFQFEGPTPSAIRYASCLTWSVKSSICGDRKNRQTLRDLYLHLLEKNGHKFARSFFPLIIQGVRESLPTTNKTDWEILRGSSLRASKYIHPPYKAKPSGNVVAAVEATLDDLAKLYDFKIEVKPLPNQYHTHREIDVIVTSTGILVDNPMEDIRFMFLSKHGIQLPDETGEIIEELNKTHVSIQRINELLWEQAIIWPLGHTTRGLWIKQDAGIDIRQYNSLNPPIDFSWIGVE